MIVSITGTPGTGKSTVSKQLEEMGYLVLHLNDIAQDEKLLLEYDKERNTHEMDINGMNDHLARFLMNLPEKNTSNHKKSIRNDAIFLEGHIAHLLDMIDLIVILRTHPSELRDRLTSKGWSESKIRENLEAEALDVITIDCLERFSQDKIFEIDTTKEDPSKIGITIIDIIEGRTTVSKPGKIDWSEVILEWY